MGREEGEVYPRAAEVRRLGRTGPALGGYRGRGGVRAWERGREHDNIHTIWQKTMIKKLHKINM